jgi:hypothetical protein
MNFLSIGIVLCPQDDWSIDGKLVKFPATEWVDCYNKTRMRETSKNNPPVEASKKSNFAMDNTAIGA